MTRTTYDNSGTNILDSTDISFGGMNVVDALQIMDAGGTNPYTLGIVDSSFNKASMDIAYCSAFSKALTTTQQKIVMNYANTFKEPHTAATVYTVTVSGGVYWISTGAAATAVQRPNLIISVGSLYVFDQSNSSGSIIALSSTLNRSSSYTTGVITNGTPGTLNAYTLINVLNGAPTTLYYGDEANGGTLSILTSPVMLSSSATSVEVGGSVTITCMTNLALPLSYTITGVSRANLNNVDLNGFFTEPSQSLSFTVTSGGGSTMTMTVSGGYTIAVNITNPSVKYVVGGLNWNGSYNVTDGNVTRADAGNIMAYSFNGTTWTGLGKLFKYSCSSIAYGNGVWVAGGRHDSYDMMKSSNGINWTPIYSTSTSPFFSVTAPHFYSTYSDWTYTGPGCSKVIFMNNTFVAIGSTSRIYYSNNGTTWSSSTCDGSDLVDITFNGTYWILSNYEILWTSNNLTTWTRKTGITNYYNNVSFRSSATTMGVLTRSGYYNNTHTSTWSTVNSSVNTDPYDLWCGYVYNNEMLLIKHRYNYGTGSVINPTITSPTVYYPDTRTLANSISFNPTLNDGTTYVRHISEIFYDKLLDKWIIIAMQGVLVKNTKTFSANAEDKKFTSITDYSVVGSAITIESTSRGTLFG
jgi:hypothetical protein